MSLERKSESAAKQSFPVHEFRNPANDSAIASETFEIQANVTGLSKNRVKG